MRGSVRLLLIGHKNCKEIVSLYQCIIVNNPLLLDKMDTLAAVSIHPPHLMDSKGRNLPAAFIPFCSYQGDTTLLGRNLEGFNFTACDKFHTSLVEGQVCYSLDLSNLTKTKSRAGRKQGLTLMLDRINPPSLKNANNEAHNSFRIFLGTMDGFSDNQDGSYRMTAIKKMVGTESFMAMSDKEKECQEEKLQDCQTRQFLEKMQRLCSCVPWALKHTLKVRLID